MAVCRYLNSFSSFTCGCHLFVQFFRNFTYKHQLYCVSNSSNHVYGSVFGLFLILFTAAVFVTIPALFSGILFANLRSLGVDVRHGSSSVPLVDRWFLCLTGIGHSFYQQRVSWCVAGWQGSSAWPLVASRFLPPIGVVGLVLGLGYFYLPVVLSVILSGWVLVAWQLPTASSSWVCLGSRPDWLGSHPSGRVCSCVLVVMSRVHNHPLPAGGSCVWQGGRSGRNSLISCACVCVPVKPTRGYYVTTRGCAIELRSMSLPRSHYIIVGAICLIS